MPIRFDWANMYSWSGFLNAISSAFTTAQLLYQEGQDETMRIAVYYTRPDHKKKEVDAETIHERVRWAFQTLKVPKNGLVVSFYELPEGKQHIGLPYFISNMWPTKERWTGGGGYITLQITQPNIGGQKKDRIYAEAPKFVAKTKELAEKFGFEVREIDYSMPYEETYQLLLKTEHHFSYAGSTYYFAGSVGAPVTAWGYEDRRIRHGKYYDYDTAEKIEASVELNQWGTITSNKIRIMQWDYENDRITNLPPTYVHHLDDPSELNLVFGRDLMHK